MEQNRKTKPSQWGCCRRQWDPNGRCDCLPIRIPREVAHTKKRIIAVLALGSLLIGQLCAKPSVTAPGSEFAHVAFTFQEECERKGGEGIEYLSPSHKYLFIPPGLGRRNSPLDEIQLLCGKEIGHFNYAHAACLAAWSWSHTGTPH